MKLLKGLIVFTCFAAMGLFGATPASAADDIRLTGTFYAWPKGGDVVQTNPEANYDKLCKKGRNGGIPWLRTGARFPIVDGNHKRIGTLRVVDAWWNDRDNPMTGICMYDIKAKNLPKTRYYCVRLPNGKIRELAARGSSDYGKRVGVSGTRSIIRGPGYWDEFSQDHWGHKPSNCANR